MVDDVKDRRLHQLGFHDRGDDLQEGLLGEDHRALRDGVDIAAEMESAEIMEEIFAEDPQASEIIHILVGKVQILDVTR